jgi:hypothetical protein
MARSEKNQSSFHLACIQTASLGLPGILLGPQLAQKYGAGTAILSACISGLILWLIGFAIVSMAIEQRRNAIENAEAYIGTPGAKLAALISILSFPIWYVDQLHETTLSINNLILGVSNFEIIKYLSGPILGILIVVFTFGKVLRIIKNVTAVFLPFLLLYYAYLMVFSETAPDFSHFELSAACTASFVSFLFAGMVNLPTFFRHARSRYDSYLSLTWITLIIVFFHISSIWISRTLLVPFIPFELPIDSALFQSVFFKSMNILFLFVLLLCSNLVNLYFSYPSWEAFFPKIKKYNKLFIIGLFNTFLYSLTLFFPNLYTILIDGNILADDFIANLGASLIFIFLVREIVKHRPTALEKVISTTSWIIGCLATIYADINGFETPVLWGIGTTALSFTIAFFIEEPFWSMKKLGCFLASQEKGE